MQKKKSGLRELVGEKNWPEMVETGHSIIPNDFMDFWSRFLPENCYFAYLEVCEGFVRQLDIKQLLTAMKRKKINPDKDVEPELAEIYQKNNYTLPSTTPEILLFLESLKLIQKYEEQGKIMYDICYPIPLPDEVFGWLPEEDLDFIELLKNSVRECHDHE